MALSQNKPTYHNLSVSAAGLGDFDINYVEAGDSSKPTFLLLHGFPSSSTQFRDFIPLISDNYHVLAPDIPGFGLTKSPPGLEYTFDNLTAAITAWLDALKITSCAMYVFDYGAPVGLRLALQNPDHIKAIVTQNGNAYEAGFGHPFWDPIMALWNKADPNSEEYRTMIRDNILTLETTKFQYTAGVPPSDLRLINPADYTTDCLMNEAGHENQEHQLALFYDYRTNPQDLYPKVHEYFRNSQVPLLAVWGKGDPAFISAGAEAFKQDLPDAEIEMVDAGHFALQTKRWEIAEAVLKFLAKVKF